MNRFNSAATRSNTHNPFQQDEIRSPFKSTGFRIGLIMFALIFITAVVFTILMFTGNLPFDYSYSVDYQFGGNSYHEGYEVK